MIVGIPKEIMHDEARVAAIPDTVKKMVAAGMTVHFEKAQAKARTTMTRITLPQAQPLLKIAKKFLQNPTLS